LFHVIRHFLITLYYAHTCIILERKQDFLRRVKALALIDGATGGERAEGDENDKPRLSAKDSQWLEMVSYILTLYPLEDWGL
jgi:hypothetical protein